MLFLCVEVVKGLQELERVVVIQSKGRFTVDLGDWTQWPSKRRERERESQPPPPPQSSSTSPPNALLFPSEQKPSACRLAHT